MDELSELLRDVEDLRRRVAQLERVTGIEPVKAPEAAAAHMQIEGGGGVVALDEAQNLVPLFGWSFMGLAGAYLLRAMTESGAMPGMAGALIGIAYAAYWLYLASCRALEKPIFSTVHGLTAAFILVPMVYETTVRFRLISLPVASGITVCFALLGLGIGWKGKVNAIAWIATISGLLTACALFRETHDAVAWAATTLAIALAVEISACRDHWLGLRWITALAADFMVLIIALTVGRNNGTAPSAVLAAQIALVTIYTASVVDRTLLRGLSITWFEIGQALAVSVVGIGGAMQISGGAIAGGFCLLGGLACYLVSFAFLDRFRGHDRNFYAYSTFALCFIAAGGSMILAGTWLTALWAVLAVVLMAAGFTRGRDTLRVHAALYLILGLGSSKLLSVATDRVVRLGSGMRPDVPLDYLVMAVGVLLCYLAILNWADRIPAHWTTKVEAILVAAAVCWSTAGILAGWLSSPPLRTALLTAIAIGAGWAGNRFRRDEFTWLAYPLLALAGLKLAVEDFAQGQSITLVASLIFFGGGLILMPRLMKKRPSSA